MNDARRSGVKWLAVGGAIAAVWIAALLVLKARGWFVYGPGVGVPVVPMLVGTTQLVTGHFVGDLARAWDSLAGWQRGILGLLIVIVAGTAIVGGVALVLSLVVG